MKSRHTKFRKKRASILDLFVLIVVLFAFSLMIIIGYRVMKGINEGIQAQSEIPASVKTMYQDSFFNKFSTVFDKLFIFLYVGFLLVALIGAWYIDTSPFFFVIGLILLAVLFLISIILSNVFGGIADNAEFTDVRTTFPAVSFFMDNLLTVAIVSATLVTITLYAKPKDNLI